MGCCGTFREFACGGGGGAALSGECGECAWADWGMGRVVVELCRGPMDESVGS